MRAIRCLVAALLAAGIVTVVAAQPGGRQFGGFGQQDTHVLILTNKALQEEVKVTDAQKTKFKDIAEKQAEMMKKAGEGLKEKFADAQGDQDKLKELFEGLQKDRTKLAEDVRKMIDAELTADQKKRLKQIQIQSMGFRVFNDPDAKAEAPKKGKGGFGGGFGGFGVSESDKALMKEVQGALKLSDSQKSTIKGLTADANKERQEIFKDAGIGGGKGGFGKVDPEKLEAANKKVDKVNKEVWAKIDEAFDDNQKKAWKNFVGEPSTPASCASRSWRRRRTDRGPARA